jgi:hypothetical protein
MKGTPRSLWLSWANRVAGYWTSAMASALQRQQRATLKAMQPKPARKAGGRKKKR